MASHAAYGTIMLVVGIAAFGRVSPEGQQEDVAAGEVPFLALIAVTLMSPVIGRPLIWVRGRPPTGCCSDETGKLAELNAIRLPDARRHASA
ncbi:hypothetical protein FAM14222_000485 [Propionibacterium freudenreichii]|uniref:hypothetical protein n=1 Tax=Propionibacterium freudenreichii TaxID=1744 RepID=UPI00254BC0EE|nr:hypothetical protein [Propionibacterium freudenreichii]MDK9592239.1 hypothetical protein [Propionibacterium freudenreichii]